MRTVLFPFQEEALVSLHKTIEFAHSSKEQFGKNSVISFSSPTGGQASERAVKIGGHHK